MQKSETIGELEFFSVFDLRELSDEDLDRGNARLSKSSGVEVLSCGTADNLIDWWRVESDGNIYNVRRFYNFCYCNCPDFQFKKTACKHLAITTPIVCPRCKKASNSRSEICGGCEAATAVYLKPEKQVERIDGMRI